MPPPMYHSEYQMATQSWQTHNNIYADNRPEHTNNYISVVSPSTIKKKPFLPTVPPLYGNKYSPSKNVLSIEINIKIQHLLLQKPSQPHHNHNPIQ